jgi:hypothetical protein
MGFPLHALVEDPDRTEAAVQQEIERARTDPGAREVLEANYLDADRQAAFERFRRSFEFERLQRLLGLLGVERTARICEVGAGGGWLAWALHTSGFGKLDVLEPNASRVTGTAYLRSRPDAAGIRIFDDLTAWHHDATRYDLVLTRNCVHHFRGLGLIAAAVREKLAPAGRWLMLREWYAERAVEVYELLRQHPYAFKYGLYEFPHSVTRYVDAVEGVGFALAAVVPAHYANGALGDCATTAGGWPIRAATGLLDQALVRAPWLTVMAHRLERAFRRLLPARLRFFSRPQALLFRRVPVPGWDQAP